MTHQAKVSPTLSALLSDSGPNDRQDAIVLYRSEPPDDWRVRGRLRDLQARLAAVEARASAQQVVQARVFADYRRAGQRRQSKAEHRPLAVRGLGGTVLPVAKMEVTRNTLGALVEQPDVVAVMPNQRVGLIAPNKVDYQALGKGEQKDGLTWGLKQLEIPDLWPTTRGADIKVAVLDTGVHGDHPALAGRVGGFIIVDPLGRRIEASLSFPGQEPALVVKPELVGPGVQVYSAIPPIKTDGGSFEYNYMDGTSMATPHVSGVVALLLAAEPQAPLQRILEVLRETARHPDGSAGRPDNRWGYGMIQPLEALKALRS